MLTEKQIEEIKEHLERAQNPLFYYDNDADGLCSFLLFRKFIGRGKGIAIRSYPELHESYASKAKELNADAVFVLDKPVLSEKFVEEINKMNLPFIWIDHHEADVKKFTDKFNNFYSYNPILNEGKDKSSEPVTYLAYKITQRKEDLWLALIGCIADRYLPDFASEFKKENPDLWGDVEDAFDAYYKTELGKIALAFNFGLKDSTSHIVQFQNFLISCKGPRDVFSEVSGNKNFREKYKDLSKKYTSLLRKAEKEKSDKCLFFEYSGEVSMSADLANGLSYRNPKIYVIVAYKNGFIANISMRGKNIKKILEKILPDFEYSSGGGHNDAVGARVRYGDLQRFKDSIFKEIG